MYLRIIAAFALSFIFYVGSSQESYHRLYETAMNAQNGMNDTIFYHMHSTTIDGDVLAVGTKRLEENTAEYEDFSVIFTRHDQKGDVLWSKELELGEDSVKIVGMANIEYNGALDSILFTMEVEINDVRTQLFGKMDKSGEGLDLQTVGGYEISGAIRPHDVSSFINQSDLLLTASKDPTISRVGLGQDLIWSNKYQFFHSNGDTALSYITDITNTQDSTILLSGFGHEMGEEFMVAELDSNGNQLWAESYTFPLNELLYIHPTDVEPLSNGNFAVTGTYVSSPAIQFNGFVAVIDSAGSILMSKKISVVNNSTEIGNIIEAADGTLWVSGIYRSQDSTLYFTTNLNTDGMVNWTTIYPDQEVAFDHLSTSMFRVNSTGGATLVGNGFLDDLRVLRVMKHDESGSAMCSDTIPMISEDLMVVADTLTAQMEDGGITFDSIGYEMSNFSDFTPPTLTVTQYPPFCPNEFIDTILVASVDAVAEENKAYMWSTGETNDTIRITAQPMEMPEFSVTVTITEDVCYILCDTVQITRLTLPRVTISLDDSRFCTENLVVLNTTYIPGASNETYLWSTGETTPSIEVTQDGTYSVVVTDECGEMATDQFELTLPTFDPLLFGDIGTINCDTEEAIITTSYSGGGDNPIFEWSTGENTNVISVSENGTYTLTVTDECVGENTFTQEVGIFYDPDAEIMANCNGIDINGSPTITISYNGGVFGGDFSVFRIEDGNSTNVSTANPAEDLPIGNYVAFVSLCGEVLDSLEVSSALCGDLISFPIAFFPNGQDESSKTFGPIPNDSMNIDEITNIDFKVFNRWGETVFQSSEILNAWDGTHKDEPAPSEVYIWYMTFTFNDEEMLLKGDVTLIR